MTQKLNKNSVYSLYFQIFLASYVHLLCSTLRRFNQKSLHKMERKPGDRKFCRKHNSCLAGTKLI